MEDDLTTTEIDSVHLVTTEAYIESDIFTTAAGVMVTSTSDKVPDSKPSDVGKVEVSTTDEMESLPEPVTDINHSGNTDDYQNLNDTEILDVTTDSKVSGLDVTEPTDTLIEHNVTESTLSSITDAEDTTADPEYNEFTTISVTAATPTNTTDKSTFITDRTTASSSIPEILSSTHSSDNMTQHTTQSSVIGTTQLSSDIDTDTQTETERPGFTPSIRGDDVDGIKIESEKESEFSAVDVPIDSDSTHSGVESDITTLAPESLIHEATTEETYVEEGDELVKTTTAIVDTMVDESTELSEGTTTIPDVLESGSCVKDGEIYSNGSDVIVSSPCHKTCSCVDGEILCISQKCQEKPPAFLRCEMVQTGECCPKYSCRKCLK